MLVLLAVVVIFAHGVMRVMRVMRMMRVMPQAFNHVSLRITVVKVRCTLRKILAQRVHGSDVWD
jgi:hypothetical protein